MDFLIYPQFVIGKRQGSIDFTSLKKKGPSGNGIICACSSIRGEGISVSLLPAKMMRVCLGIATTTTTKKGNLSFL